MKKLYFILCLFFPLLSSCEDYLDINKEMDLDKEDVFKDFVHAQGYAEMMYYYVVNYAQSGNQNDASNFLLGDETVMKGAQTMCGGQWEIGNFWNYKVGYFEKSPNHKFDDILLKGHMGIWDGWDAIRVANTLIASESLMTGCTDTEKKLLLGQAYFFRAYFHMEILKFWGRIPYVDKVITGNDDFKFERPKTYKEVALRIDEDFAKAAELLPNNWDDLKNDPNATFLTFKWETYGNNLMRINKPIVYSFKGKNLLFAASPLMHGSLDTYDYDEELCERAAEDFAKVIKMDRDNVNNLGLATKDNYSKVFHTLQSDNTKWPGTADYMGGEGEYIFSSPAGHVNGSRAIALSMMPVTNGPNKVTPNHEFVYKTFGTKNGLTCDEDPSFDKNNMFVDRDPRFYMNLVIDGDEVIKNANAKPVYKYAQMYVGGNLQKKESYYDTGYFIKKWADITCNQPAAAPESAVDNQQMINSFWLSMRLADVYLMYAESLAATEKYGVTGKPQYDFLNDAPSSIDVINMLRTRFGVPTVQDSYNIINIDIESDRNKYMDVLRRERAIELCFEAHRWMDLRRWVLAHKEEYRLKTALLYDRDKPGNLSVGQFKNINFRTQEVLTRICEYPKHYWLPFPKDLTLMYEGFEQNPGW